MITPSGRSLIQVITANGTVAEIFQGRQKVWPTEGDASTFQFTLTSDLHVTLRIHQEIPGTLAADWGDSSERDIFEKEVGMLEHDYGEPGTYTVQLIPRKGVKWMPGEDDAWSYYGFISDMVEADKGTTYPTLTGFTLKYPARLGYASFGACTGLEMVDVPAYISEIPDSAFKLCANLKTVTLHEGLVRIDSYAFQDCAALRDISLPSSVRYINQYAFSNCGALQGTLEVFAMRVSQRAYQKCTGLRKIWIRSSVAALDTSIFFSCSEELVIFCEPESRPDGWDENFDLRTSSVHHTVIWGQSISPFEEAP